MASLPYPRSLLQQCSPTDFTDFTEQTGREYSPTDFTDLHRYLLPQNSRNTEQIGREYYPTDFTDLHRYLLPQNSRNSQNRLAENILPQISQIYTDIYSHRIHGIHRTDWQRIFSHRFHRFTQIFTPTEFTEFTEHFAYICEICGSFFSAINFRLPGGALVSSAPTY